MAHPDLDVDAPSHVAAVANRLSEPYQAEHGTAGTSELGHTFASGITMPLIVMSSGYCPRLPMATPLSSLQVMLLMEMLNEHGLVAIQSSPPRYMKLLSVIFRASVLCGMGQSVLTETIGVLHPDLALGCIVGEGTASYIIKS